MTITPLPIPTPDLVRDAQVRFDQDESSGPADRVLYRVFAHHPDNVELEDVLLKVVLLNGLYATNVFALTAMATHIHRLQIDPKLASGSTELVDQIACLEIRGKTLSGHPKPAIKGHFKTGQR